MFPKNTPRVNCEVSASLKLHLRYTIPPSPRPIWSMPNRAILLADFSVGNQARLTHVTISYPVVEIIQLFHRVFVRDCSYKKHLIAATRYKSITI